MRKTDIYLFRRWVSCNVFRAWVAGWLSGSTLVSINEIRPTLHRARLVYNSTGMVDHRRTGNLGL